MTASNGIRVDSYVQRSDGTLVSFDELEGEERARAATQLKCKWLNGLFMGEAAFTPDYPTPEEKKGASGGMAD